MTLLGAERVRSLALTISIGAEFGRCGRVTAPIVLWVGVALLLAGAWRSPSIDALPAAPAAAVLLAEGTLWVVFLLRRSLRRGSVASPPLANDPSAR